MLRKFDEEKRKIEERSIVFSETIDDFGKLDCKIMYLYYDLPLIYDLSNESFKFLAYAFDNCINLFMIMTIEEQIELENNLISLKNFIKKRDKAYIVEYKDEIKVIGEMNPSLLTDDQLPDENVYLITEIEE